MRLFSVRASEELVNSPVLRVGFSDRFVFLRKPESYAVLVQNARRKFALPDDADIHFVALTGSVTGEVEETEFDEDVYELISGVLDDIKLVLREARVQPVAKEKGKQPEQAVERNNPEYKVASSSSTSEADQTFRDSQEEDVRAPTQAGNRTFEEDVRAPIQAVNRTLEEDEQVFIKKQLITSIENIFDDDTPSQTSVKKQLVAPKVENIFDDDIASQGSESATEEEESAQSSTRTSEHWEQVPVEPKFHPSRAKEEAKVSVKKQPSPVQPPVKAPKKQPSPVPPPAKAQEKQNSSQSQVVDANERYKVIITGPYPGQEAEFMTRGGHLVRKVLQGACRTFSLDFDRAQLMLLVQADDEEDGIPFKLENEDTMARAGVEPNAKLVIELSDDD